MLPNGISCLFGPTSARVHDVTGILQMSGLDQFLLELQQGNNHIYSALGDGIYNANGLQCKLDHSCHFILLASKSHTNDTVHT